MSSRQRHNVDAARSYTGFGDLSSNTFAVVGLGAVLPPPTRLTPSCWIVKTTMAADKHTPPHGV